MPTAVPAWTSARAAGSSVRTPGERSTHGVDAM